MSERGTAEHRRPLYTHDELLPLIRPRSIAVVGASGGDTGFGNQALRRVLESRVSGPVYAVHPRYADLEPPAGVIGVTGVEALPEPVDCVLVAVPAPAVFPVVAAAAERKCGSSIIFSAGFAETGDGQSAEMRLRRLAQDSGMRIGGPNTAGVLNYRDNLALTFVGDLRMELPSGNLAVVGQSAGLATHLGHRRHRGARLSYTMTTGNSADVNAFDYVNFLLDDDATDVVALAIEGVDDPNHLRQVGERSRQVGKPVLVLKTGRTRRGGRAAVSHTGSLAGRHEIFLEAAADAGLEVFTQPDELLDTALLFARWADRPYRPGGAAVLTTMGGPGVIAADAADDHDVDLPDPSPDTVSRLGELIPAFAATANPIDTTAFPSDGVLAELLTALGDDPAYGAVVVLLATTTGAATARRPAAVIAAARRCTTPVAAVWLSSWLDGPGSELLDEAPDVPVFRTSDHCFRALRSWRRWHERSPLVAYEPGSEPPPAEQPPLPATSGLLDESASREILAAWGVRFPQARVADSPEAAASATADIGRPVVVKVLSDDVPHKAAAGGVELDIRTPEQAASACRRILRSVAERHPDAELGGVLVAEMVRAVGPEFMCGLVRDPVFGPVVVVGAGGTDVEQTRDLVRCLAPVTPDRAARAIRRLRTVQSLRMRDPEQAEVLERELGSTMVILGRLGEHTPGIAEVDLNPVVLADTGELTALDALVVIA